MRAIDAPNFKITGELEPPINIPYNVYLFHKKETIIAGELRIVEYYRDYTPATATEPEVYSDLILIENRDYTRNSHGLAVFRTLTISWYLDNGTIGYTKVSEPKYYNTKDAFDEAETRRKNIMAEAKLYILWQFSLQVGAVTGKIEALALMTILNTEIQLYIQGQINSLITALQLSANLLLTPTIKTNVIAILQV